jgi:hypothetical protein
MPTVKEMVQNKPLRGDELAEIIVNDVKDMLLKDTMFGGHVAYGVLLRDSVELSLSSNMTPDYSGALRIANSFG